LLLNYGDHKLDEENSLHQYFFSELEEVEFKTAAYQQILALIKSELDNHGSLDHNRLMEQVSGEVKTEIIDLLTERYEISNLWMDKFQIHVPTEKEILPDVAYTNLLRLKYRVIKKLIAENREELRMAGSEDQQKLLHVDVALKKSRNEIAKLLGIILSD
jgi:DNA primase